MIKPQVELDKMMFRQEKIKERIERENQDYLEYVRSSRDKLYDAQTRIDQKYREYLLQ